MDAAIERLNALRLQEKRNPFALSSEDERQNAARHHAAAAVVSPQSQQQADQHALEMQRLHAQFQQSMNEQAQRMQQMQHDLQATQARLQASERQNGLLRTALEASETYKHQIADQGLVIEELQNQVKSLRLTNYRLQYMIQQTEPRGHNAFLPPPPPDIF